MLRPEPALSGQPDWESSRDLFPDDHIQTRANIGHFHSGVNTSGLIRGYADAAQPICLPVNDVRPPIVELLLRASERCLVLADSGAFGAFTSAVRALDPDGGVPHFEDESWRQAALPLATLDFAKVADAYRQISARHPQNITIVLPDIVGFQAESLELLSRYREHFAWTRQSPVTTLLPIQRGSLTPAHYHRRAVEELGFVPDGWGFPSREAAMSVEEIVQGVRDAIEIGVRRIHFLGAGRESKRFGHILRAINAIPGVADLEMTTDANTTRAYVGQGRPQTLRRYEVRDAVPEAWLNLQNGLDMDEYAAICWGAYLDGECPELVAPIHAALNAAGLRLKVPVSAYSDPDQDRYRRALLDPETGDIDERIDRAAREAIKDLYRRDFDGFATAAAAFDFFKGYPQPHRMFVAEPADGSLHHVLLGAGIPTRKPLATETHELRLGSAG